MSITLFDIFYEHTEWWRDPSLGNDTQGKYGIVLAEMESCAVEYAKGVKDIGDNWKRVIENETRKLCSSNHYSIFLSGEKKEWHDMEVEEFLLKVRKALEHFGFDFKELPRTIQALYGIEYFVTDKNAQPKAPETPQQADNDAGEELQGGEETMQPEQPKKPLQKELLPTLYESGEMKSLEQSVYYNAISSKHKWMSLNPDGKSYTWYKKKKQLAYLCGCLYWGDSSVLDKKEQLEYGYEVYKLKKSDDPFSESIRLKELFGGIDVSNNRSQLKKLPPNWEEIDNLFK